MYFSGKITNSFFTFLKQYDLDTNRFFEITTLEIDGIKNPYSCMSADLVEKLLRNIQRAYYHKFPDKDLVTTVGHNAPHLKAWGGTEDVLIQFCDSPYSIYQKIDHFLNQFISPAILVSNKKNNKDYFSFELDFETQRFPTVQQYFLSVFEILPVFVGQDQTEAHWEGNKIKIYYHKEETLPLPGLKSDTKDKTFLISDIKAREIIDSRGQPSLEVDLFCDHKKAGQGRAPSGTSTGKFEAKELRDGDPSYFFKKGLKKACKNVSQLASLLKNQDIRDQKAIDKKLLKADNSPNKNNLGANTLLAISLAGLRASAHLSNKALYEYARLNSKDLYLPVPLMNILNGGLHASNTLDVQEFMIVPHDFPTFKEALRASCEIFYQLKQDLKSKGFSTAVGDEGGFSPQLSDSSQAFDFILNAIEKSSYTGKVALALDCASSEFYKGECYFFENKKRSSQDMIALYKQWIKDYPLISIEDGLAEEDWSGWKSMTQQIGNQIQLVGDDLFCHTRQKIKPRD